MSQNKSTDPGAAIFPTLLAIAFIVLKLCKVISWPWLWVLSPIWIPLAVAIAIGLLYLLYYHFKS